MSLRATGNTLPVGYELSMHELRRREPRGDFTDLYSRGTGFEFRQGSSTMAQAVGQSWVSHRGKPRPTQGPLVDEVVLGQVFLRALRFPPVTIIQPMLHTYLFCLYRQRCLTLATGSVVK
jgi:hypothetical protein